MISRRFSARPLEGSAPNHPRGEKKESPRPRESVVPSQPTYLEDHTRPDAGHAHKIQKKMLEKHEDGDKEDDRVESETVRNRVQPLPLLQEWSATSGPIDLND